MTLFRSIRPEGVLRQWSDRRTAAFGAGAGCLVLIAASAGASGAGRDHAAAGADRVHAPGVVSVGAAEVRLAISPDGRHALWGAIGREGPADQQDIWERRLDRGRWSEPARVSFSTPDVEFDPAFSADGRRVYFHSDRPGGSGGTDIHVVPVDPATGVFGEPRNLGPAVNSPGDEWAPTPTPDGRLIFASDGHGGFGLHDLFEVDLSPGASPPVNLGPGVNGPLEDFDGALTPDGRQLVFSSGLMTGETPTAGLFLADSGPNGWGQRRPLATGCSAFMIGAAFDPRAPGTIYYAADCPGGRGRMDIRRTRFGP